MAAGRDNQETEPNERIDRPVQRVSTTAFIVDMDRNPSTGPAKMVNRRKLGTLQHNYAVRYVTYVSTGMRVHVIGWR